MNKTDFSKIYSYSKLKLFETCPQQYYFNYLDPEIAPIKKQFIKPRDYKVKGQAVHGAITLFYHLSEKKRTFDDLKKCLAKSWYSEIDMTREMPLGESGGFRDLLHERESYAEALKMLKNFFNIFKSKETDLNLFYIPTNEIKKSFCDYEEMIQSLGKNRYISGKFDRIDKMPDNSLRIVDFKTGKKDSDKFQLTFYKLLAELNFDLPVKTVTFYYLNKGEVVDFDLSKTTKASIKKQVGEKIKKIEDAWRFPPHFNGLCNHCDFKEICSANKIIKPKKHD